MVISVEVFKDYGAAKTFLSEVLMIDGEVSQTFKRGVSSPDMGVMYIEISKVACSSIKDAFGRAYDLPEEKGQDWRNGVLDWIDLENETAQKAFKFSFVRNPWNRLVSAYENKFNRPEASQSVEPYRMALKELMNTDDVTFELFVHAMNLFPDWVSNIHWQSQHLFLADGEGETLVDFVGCFESLEADVSSKGDGHLFPVHSISFESNDRRRTMLQIFLKPGSL